MEVSQHVRHRVEPQVVDVALSVLIHRQAQMLGGARESVSGEKRHVGQKITVICPSLVRLDLDINAVVTCGGQEEETPRLPPQLLSPWLCPGS